MNQREHLDLIITAAMMEAGMSDDQTVAELPDTIRSLRALVISQQEVTCGLQNLHKHDAKVREALASITRFDDITGTEAIQIASDALAKVKEGKDAV